MARKTREQQGAPDPDVVKVTDLSVFLTRQQANEGIVMPLFTREGQATDKWIRIRGADSDEYRAQQADSLRRLAPLAEIKDEISRREAIELEKRKSIAALVMGWNLALDFTQEKILWLLQEAPQIADQIDRVSTRRAFFFRQRPWSSSTGQASSSGSNESRPGQANQSE
jgi:hypothetical protein